MSQEKASKNSYSYLEQLSTSLLEEFISSDFNGEGLQNDELILAALEVLKKRKEKEGLLPDIDAAWSDFKEHYDTPDMSSISLYNLSPDAAQLNKKETEPTRASHKRIFRYIGSVAAAIAVLLACTICVQAAGIDIFGALATWTDDVFHFATSSHITKNEALANALIETDMADALMPAWFPERFIPEEPVVFSNPDYSEVSMYLDDQSGEGSMLYSNEWYADKDLIGQYIIEKDSGPVEVKVINGVEYYIMSNLDEWSAAWQIKHYVGLLSGKVSYDEIITIIESMGVP